MRISEHLLEKDVEMSLFSVNFQVVDYLQATALKKDFNTGIFQWFFGKILRTEKCGQFSYNFTKVGLCCILFQETFVYIDIVYLLESAATKKCKLWAADTWLVPTGTFKSLIIQKISRKVFAVDFSVVKQVLVIQL